MSYWGRPHDYLWFGTFSPTLLYQQMGTAYDKGVQRMWILNVGDIKPAEYQIELFMDMAKVRQMGVGWHLENFLQREFGMELGKELFPMMAEHYRLAYIHKPEFMGNTRTEEADRHYSIVKDMPWTLSDIDARLAAYQKLEDEAERLFDGVTGEHQDEFFQLVKYPIQAAAEMNKKLLKAQKARHGLCSWEESDAAFDSIVSLTRLYNQGIRNEGKWNCMMHCQPRNLPVFNRVTREAATEPMCEALPYFLKANGADCTEGTYVSYEGLGYEGKAVAVEKGGSIAFDFGSADADSAEIEVRFVPPHAIDGSTLRFSVTLDEGVSQMADY